MKLSLDVHRIKPIHTMEKNKHIKEQDEEIKIPKQNTASPIPHSNEITYMRHERASEETHVILVVSEHVVAITLKQITSKSAPTKKLGTKQQLWTM